MRKRRKRDKKEMRKRRERDEKEMRKREGGCVW